MFLLCTEFLKGEGRWKLFSKNPVREKFKNGMFKFNQKLSHLRLTVDEPEDFLLVEKIYQFLEEEIQPVSYTHQTLPTKA